MLLYAFGTVCYLRMLAGGHCLWMLRMSGVSLLLVATDVHSLSSRK